MSQKNDKLPTAAKVTNDGTMADECVSIKKGNELVRRKDVEKLIQQNIDYIYEEEHNADLSQERASIEILEKLLEEVQNEPDN